MWNPLTNNKINKILMTVTVLSLLIAFGATLNEEKFAIIAWIICVLSGCTLIFRVVFEIGRKK